MTVNTDFNPSEQYTLSIRLCTDGFSFSLSSPAGEASLLQEYQTDESLSLTANLKQAFRTMECLSRPYHRVNVLIANRRVTYLPLEYFEDKQVEIMFYHNHPRRDNEQILYNILHKNNIVVLFGMDRSSHIFLQEQYPDVHFYAQAAPLIEYFAREVLLNNSNKMYVHLHHDAFDLFAYKQGKLLLANSFACSEVSDRIYYLLYTWKQLDFEQEHDELHLTGDLTDKELLLPELRKFIRQVFVMNSASNNLDLQAITSCE